MPVFTTEGIIIRRKNFGEADRILTVITPYRGKISIIAKGVRKITSRRAGNIELLNKARLHIFQGRGMGILTEAESIKTYPELKSDLILSTYSSHILELVNRLVPENQINPGSYQLLCQILEVLEKKPRQIFIRAFEIKLLSELGFWEVTEKGEMGDVLGELEKGRWEEIDKIKINQKQAVELERILRYYIEKVLEGSLKSLEIIRKLT